MTMVRIIRCFAVSTLLFVCGVALSQTAGKPSEPVPGCDPQLTASPAGSAPCEGAPEQPPASADDSSSRPVDDPSPAGQATLHYTPALNGGDPIIIPQPFRIRYMFGAGGTQGFDSAAAGSTTNVPSGVSTLDGYVAASVQGRRSYLLMQHASSFTHYSSSELQSQMFLRTALLASGDFTRSLSWSLGGLSTLGDDALLLINPLPARMVGQFATTAPVSAAYGINQGRIWGADLEGSLNWKPNAKGTVKLDLKNEYHRRLADDVSDNIGGARIEYVKQATQRTSYGFYGQGAHETGEVICTSTGGGFQLATKPTVSTLAELAIGPEFGSSGCGRRQAFTLHATLAGTLSSSIRAYVGVNREFSSGYVRRGTWEDNVVAGLGKQFSHQISWSVDAGYVKGTLLGSVTGYHGYFAATEVRKRITESLAALATYRRFDHSISNEGVRRNVVMMSLVWTPSRHNAQRSNPYEAVKEQAAGTGRNHED